MYKARRIVGSSEKKNIHPHDYIIEKTDGKTFLYFVDPEQSLQSKIRPKAVYLETMCIDDNGGPAEVAIFRCRASDLSDTKSIKADSLLEEARNLIKNEGLPEFLNGEDLPTFMKEGLEKQILIRLLVKQESGLIQIQKNITVNENTISKTFEGKSQSPIIESIINSHQMRVQQFIDVLKQEPGEIIDKETGKKSKNFNFTLIEQKH
jgi:hypothetical protein